LLLQDLHATPARPAALTPTTADVIEYCIWRRQPGTSPAAPTPTWPSARRSARRRAWPGLKRRPTR